MTARSTLGCGILKNPLRQPKVNLRAHCGTTVPFVAGTFIPVWEPAAPPVKFAIDAVVRPRSS